MCVWSFPEGIKAAQENAMELCLLSLRYNINTVPVDVASLLEVNHVKFECYVIVHVISIYLFAYLLSVAYMLSFNYSQLHKALL